MKKKCLAIIPARYGSSRLFAKVLEQITPTETLIQKVYFNAKKALGEEHVVIATDHQRIVDHCQSFGAQVVLTGECATGSDRVYQAYKMLNRSDDIILNLQGDAPFFSPDLIQELIQFMESDSISYGTLAFPLSSNHVSDDLFRFFYQKKTKVVLSQTGRALFFSRASVPSFGRLPDHVSQKCLIHLGIYAYTPESLEKFYHLSQTPLEQLEGLEQLRLLEHDESVHVKLVSLNPEAMISVDTQDDLEKARKWFANHLSS
jgi:3-deoxy-manno-octulosonate cytidylyltransferase (CMP-KDO synthetase)